MEKIALIACLLALSSTASADCKNGRKDAVPARDRDPARYTRYDSIISEASRQYSIPEALIHAVIKTESDYDPRVVSCANASGLMQLMPDEVIRFGITDVFDPRQNILGGTRLLRENANRWCDGQGHCNLLRAVADYHGGHAGINRWVKNYGGIPAHSASNAYVWTVRDRWLGRRK